MSSLGDAPPPYGTVVFDCDSTLSAIEGIEELAGDALGAELVELTSAAMDGRVPLEAVYGHRLALVRPSREDVRRVGELYVENALPHARELCAALCDLGKRVCIVSGGLLPAVARLGSELGIAPGRIRAVDLHWDTEGAYAGFEEGSPLARAGGKIDVLTSIAGERGAGPVAFVGDGATDLEAAHLAARFIAYGGVVRRPTVFQAARVRCDAPDLAALVPLLFSPLEMATLAETGHHSGLLTAARSQA